MMITRINDRTYKSTAVERSKICKSDPWPWPGQGNFDDSARNISFLHIYPLLRFVLLYFKDWLFHVLKKKQHLGSSLTPCRCWLPHQGGSQWFNCPEQRFAVDADHLWGHRGWKWTRPSQKADGLLWKQTFRASDALSLHWAIFAAGTTWLAGMRPLPEWRAVQIE